MLQYYSLTSCYWYSSLPSPNFPCCFVKNIFGLIICWEILCNIIINNNTNNNNDAAADDNYDDDYYLHSSIHFDWSLYYKMRNTYSSVTKTLIRLSDPYHSQYGPPQSCVCRVNGAHAHGCRWARARRRNRTPPVKHGCAFEERKMLNCVGKSREKQQTWLDWLTISLSWDMTTRKLVSFSAIRALTAPMMVFILAVVSVGWCWCHVIASTSLATYKATMGDLQNTLFSNTSFNWMSPTRVLSDQARNPITKTTV